MAQGEFNFGPPTPPQINIPDLSNIPTTPVAPAEPPTSVPVPQMPVPASHWQPEVRQPRAWLMIGSQQINLLEWEAMLVRKSQPGSFEAVMALDDPTNPGIEFWSSASPIQATLLATNGDGSGQAIISGQITKVEVNIGPRTVRVQGRDPVQQFLNSFNDQQYPNTPTGQVVGQLAAKHGLGFYTDGGTDMAGRTFNGTDYAYNSDVQNDWDVVQDCASQDGKVCFVNGNTLYYVDPGNVLGAVYDIEYIPPSSESYDAANAIEIVLLRDLQLSEGVMATAASYLQPSKQPTTGTSGGGNAQFYDDVPGLTQSQAADSAMRKSSAAMMFEYSCEVHGPGDVNVQPTMMLNLSGTQSAWDITYYITSVHFTSNPHDGFLMDVVAFNSSPEFAGYSPSDTDTESGAQDQDDSDSTST